MVPPPRLHIPNQTTMSFQSNCWDMFYAGYTAKDALNKKLDQIIKLLPARATHVKCITMLQGIPGLSLLAVDEFDEILLLHQVTFTGPNLLQPKIKFMALAGMSTITDCYWIHSSSFTGNIDIPCPKWSDVKAAVTTEEVAALHILKADSPKLKGKKLLPILPVAASTIISVGMSNAAVLIPIVLVALQEYDRTSETGAMKSM